MNENGACLVVDKVFEYTSLDLSGEKILQISFLKIR